MQKYLIIFKNFIQIQLKLREKPDSGVYIQDLSQFNVSSPAEMMKYLDEGHSNRHVGETKMNRESSRSHR